MKVATGIVYQLLDAEGCALYIGVSNNPSVRIRQHRFNGKGWWADVTDIVLSPELPRAEAEALERRLIRELQPRHNVADRFGLTAVEIARACGRSLKANRYPTRTAS